MNFALIYFRTARGDEELNSHSRALTPAMRRMLIMIDGKRTAAELELFAREGEFDEIIAALKAHGLIRSNGMESAAGPRVAPPDATTLIVRPGGPTDRRTSAAPAVMQPPAPAPDTRAAQQAAATLEERKRAAISALYARLGPYGEEPAQRILACKTFEALQEQIRSAGQRIALFRDAQAAQEYVRQFGVPSATTTAAPVSAPAKPVPPVVHRLPPATLQPH